LERLLRHKQHRAIDRALLGKEFPDVHEWMDKPAVWLGPSHRIMRHSPLEILLKYHDDPERAFSALLHLLADEADSKLKRKVRKKKR
jgi:hypothetical protein